MTAVAGWVVALFILACLFAILYGVVRAMKFSWDIIKGCPAPAPKRAVQRGYKATKVIRDDPYNYNGPQATPGFSSLDDPGWDEDLTGLS